MSSDKCTNKAIATSSNCVLINSQMNSSQAFTAIVYEINDYDNIMMVCAYYGTRIKASLF